MVQLMANRTSRIPLIIAGVFAVLTICNLPIPDGGVEKIAGAVTVSAPDMEAPGISLPFR